jgi:acetyltransferase-like isoleucine patch superfamily enzyme
VTHCLDVMTAPQSTKPLRIGDYCMVGDRVCFAQGSRVSNFSVVGMGAVVTTAFTESSCLIAGNPARVIKKSPEDAAYFTRAEEFISLYILSPYKSGK